MGSILQWAMNAGISKVNAKKALDGFIKSVSRALKNGDKVTFLAVCGKDAVKAGVKAGDIVKHVCTVCGGSGGGKPDSAMGGGKDATKLDDALALVDNYVSSKI